MPKKTKSIMISIALPSYSFSFLLFILCFMFQAIPSYAIAELNGADSVRSTDPETDCEGKCPEINVQDRCIRGGLLYDVATNTIVWEKNKDLAYPIASLTKMMVALIAIEDIYAGKTALDSTVRVTPEASKMNGSKVFLKTGYRISVEELLKAALISSGNDAAYLLAQHLGGSEEAFVHQMNRRAASLGMKNTFYSNATGMPAPRSFDDNRSTPSDLLVLAKEMLKHEQLMEIAGTSKDIITQDQKIIRLRNHNRLVTIYSEVDGFKTGFTQNAKYCLVATSKKNDRRLISIALGVESREKRNQFVASNINQYYEALGMGKLERKTNGAFQPSVAKASSPDVMLKRGYADAAVLNPDPANGGVYRIKKGDTLYKIANKYGCTVAQLKVWNQMTGNRLDPGQELTVYGNSQDHNSLDQNNNDETSPDLQASADDSEPADTLKVHHEKAQKAVFSEKANSRIIHYTIRRGDTLWNISQKYEGISIQDIMKTNHIRKAKDLKPGTSLKIVLDV